MKWEGGGRIYTDLPKKCWDQARTQRTLGNSETGWGWVGSWGKPLQQRDRSCNGSCVPGRVGGGGQGGRPVREVVRGHRDPHELGFSPSDGGTTEGL